jgi:ribonucleoside-diphosphate reductase alpha chain
MAHLKMMAAVQPFISGAISKTINMPEESTAEDIAAAYMEGWKLGLKAVAIYRDGSKKLQPVATSKHKEAMAKTSAGSAGQGRPFRHRLPDTRHSITHKFSVVGHEGYLTVGLYEDGQPGELFITMAKEGSTIGGLMDVIGTCTSMALQYGVPLIALVDKFRHARFEPSGMTSNKDIPFAKSLIDYIFCWLGCQFIPGYADKNMPNRAAVPVPAENKNVTTARELVEKTKDLAQKIAEVKAVSKVSSKKAVQVHPDISMPQQVPASVRTRLVPASSESGHDGSLPGPAGPDCPGQATKHPLAVPAGRFTDPPLADCIGTAGASDPGSLESEIAIMQQFNAQFEHFGDDAPACDICGSITVRNGSCYKCYNCGNSMGCS